MAIEWTEDLSVGVTEIDNQHKELFRQINMLIEACHQGRGAQAVGEVLSFLDSYARLHFGTEEDYMQKYQFPGMESHRRQHQEFIANLTEVKERFAQEGPGVHIVVITNRILAGWLNNHIRRSDKVLGAHIKAHSGA
jgi:hemerythrin